MRRPAFSAADARDPGKARQEGLGCLAYPLAVAGNHGERGHILKKRQQAKFARRDLDERRLSRLKALLL